MVTAALLLPGIIAARCFYQASRTDELEPSIPPLSSTDGIALIGLFSVVVHLCFVAGLVWVASLEPRLPLPLADPYHVFTPAGLKLQGRDEVFGFLLGLAWLCGLAMPLGYAGGAMLMRLGDRSIFYGALTDVVTAGRDDGRFIAAYVVTKLRHERRAIGYQGTVASMVRDGDRFPTKLLLKEASIFYLDFGGDAPVRQEQPDLISWIALSAADWENVAFQVFEIEFAPEEVTQDAGARRLYSFRALGLLAFSYVASAVLPDRRR